jgi:hypothetical protein
MMSVSHGFFSTTGSPSREMKLKYNFFVFIINKVHDGVVFQKWFFNLKETIDPPPRVEICA